LYFVLPTSEASKEAHTLRQYILYVYVNRLSGKFATSKYSITP